MTRCGDSFLLHRHTPKFQNSCCHCASRIAEHSCWSPPKKKLNETKAWFIHHIDGCLLYLTWWVLWFLPSLNHPVQDPGTTLAFPIRQKLKLEVPTNLHLSGSWERCTWKLFAYYYALFVGLKFDSDVSLVIYSTNLTHSIANLYFFILFVHEVTEFRIGIWATREIAVFAYLVCREKCNDALSETNIFRFKAFALFSTC